MDYALTIKSIMRILGKFLAEYRPHKLAAVKQAVRIHLGIE